MIRDVSKLKTGPFDVVIIGGGIYGSWMALYSALSGLKVALVEKSDWGSATSSSSSKLLHGGLRYLERYEFGLVRKSLQERKELNRLLPHQVRPLRFLLPVYRDSRVGKLQLKAGLWLYDLLAGRNQPVGRRQSFSAAQLVQQEPALSSDNLVAGFSYGDCGTDDFRMVLEVVDTAMQNGVTACHYMTATELLKAAGRATGVRLNDRLTGETFDVHASIVINAAGPWVFQQFGLGEEPQNAGRVRLTKGVHLVMPPLSSNNAVLLTAKSDGRVFFLIPWYGRTLLGTTDTDYSGNPADVRVESQDINYLLDAANGYLKTRWSRTEVHGAYVGLRTLQNEADQSASGVSREWSFEETIPGLMTSLGGKYTSARIDATSAVNHILTKLNRRTRRTWSELKMAWSPNEKFATWMQNVCRKAVAQGMDEHSAETCARRHGANTEHLLQLVAIRPELAERIVPDLPFCKAELVYAAASENAVSLVDILRRRVPLMLLTQLNVQLLQKIGELVSPEFGWDDPECSHQVNQALARSARWKIWPIATNPD